MLTIPISPLATVAITALTAATVVVANAITRIVLCRLAVSAARKALEDPDAGQIGAADLRAHRLAVLRAILAALTIRGRAGAGDQGARRLPPAQDGR